eukprot:3952781-Pleurochrysis_carterae.AAC.1
MREPAHSQHEYARCCCAAHREAARVDLRKWRLVPAPLPEHAKPGFWSAAAPCKAERAPPSSRGITSHSASFRRARECTTSR